MSAECLGQLTWIGYYNCFSNLTNYERLIKVIAHSLIHHLSIPLVIIRMTTLLTKFDVDVDSRSSRTMKGASGSKAHIG